MTATNCTATMGHSVTARHTVTVLRACMHICVAQACFTSPLLVCKHTNCHFTGSPRRLGCCRCPVHTLYDSHVPHSGLQRKKTSTVRMPLIR